jgi:RNA polymerase sigma-70 factor (ECF subfamily)
MRAARAPSPTGESPVRTQLAADQQLLWRFQAGDVDADLEIYQRVRRPALAAARRVLRDESGAEDVVHDTILKILQRRVIALSRIDTLEGVVSYIVRMAVNRALDKLRERQRRQDASLSQELVDALIDTASEDDRVRFQDLIGSLAPDEREILCLRFESGFTVEEVAELLTLTLHQVRYRIDRAQARVRVLIEKERS